MLMNVILVTCSGPLTSAGPKNFAKMKSSYDTHLNLKKEKKKKEKMNASELY